MDFTKSVPSDVWAMITSLLDCVSVAWLRQTSKRMKQVLENGGVQSWSHVGPLILSHPIKDLETYVKKFKGLKSLRLYGNPVDKTYQWLPEIRTLHNLPEGLRVLHLAMSAFPTDENELLDLLPRNLVSFSLTVSVRKQLFFTLNRFPLSLTSLCFNGNFTSGETTIGVDESLPWPQLEYLNAAYQVSGDALISLLKYLPQLSSLITYHSPADLVNLLPVLPPNLKFLAVPNWPLRREHLPDLPQHLTYLDCSWAISLTPDDLYLMPPKLVHLSMAREDLNSAFVALKAEAKGSGDFSDLALRIPRSHSHSTPFRFHLIYQDPETHYYLHNKTDCDGELLNLEMPFLQKLFHPNLTSLQLRAITGEFHPSEFPTSLTKLCIEYLRITSSTVFPNQLLHLEIGAHFTHLFRLPPRLHTLKLLYPETNDNKKPDFYWIPHRPPHAVGCEDISLQTFLPRSLTHFSAACRSSNQLDWVPPGLTELSLKWASGVMLTKEVAANLKVAAFQTDETINDDTLTNLSNGLHTLILSWNNKITALGLQWLPSTLTILDLHWNEKAVNDTSAASLPRGITKLNINCSNLLSHVGIALLPPQLTELRWNRCNLICPRAFAAFPRSLTFLTLNENLRIPSEGFKYLTDSLRHLEMANLHYFEKAEHAADLPAKLEFLDLQRLKSLPATACALLPRGLNHLDISSSDVKATDLGKLPHPRILKLPKKLLETSQLAHVLRGPYAKYYEGRFADSLA
jgi:hypothetical protein